MTTKDDTIKKIIGDLENVKSALNDKDLSEANILAFTVKLVACKDYINAVLDKDIEELREIDTWFKPSYHFDK